MAVMEFQKLPLGFRFRPSDEELVNYYLKRKITGRIKNEVEVIPEIDVCKCEPWDLPDKSLIKSDDSEWFFFAPKDRKYPNGHRTNRATEAGYWKATGKDRIIRSKPASSAKATIVGTKKTLVFHKGRAPKGVRTHWIMHEYRTTEPEYESGEQGGYVLYKLFRKEDERGTSRKPDEIETSNFSPPLTKSSPSDTPIHEADTVGEFGTPMDPESPKSELQEELNIVSPSLEKQPVGIRRWLADTSDCSATYPVKPEESNSNLAPHDHEANIGGQLQVDDLEDILAQFCESEYDQIKADCFPDTSSPLLPCSDPLSGDNNQESYAGLFPNDNTEEGSLNEFLNSVLVPDEPSGGSFVQKGAPLAESASSSDLEIEPGLMQGLVDMDSSDWFYGTSLLANDSFQISDTNICPEMETQRSALYEDASLLPYDSAGPDAFSIDSHADSLQDIFNSMQNSNNHKLGSSGITGGTGITIRPRNSVDPTALLNKHFQQGNAPRRLKLQTAIRKLPFNRESGGDKNDSEDTMATVKSLKALSESKEMPASEGDALSCTGSSEGTDINNDDETTVSSQHLNSELDSLSNSVVCIGEYDEGGDEDEAQENSGDNVKDTEEVLRPVLKDHQELSDEMSHSSISHPELTLRMRSRLLKSNDDLQEALPPQQVTKSQSVGNHIIWVFPVFLLLTALGCGLLMVSRTV